MVEINLSGHRARQMKEQKIWRSQQEMSSLLAVSWFLTKAYAPTEAESNCPGHSLMIKKVLHKQEDAILSIYARPGPVHRQVAGELHKASSSEG